MSLIVHADSPQSHTGPLSARFSPTYLTSYSTRSLAHHAHSAHRWKGTSQRLMHSHTRTDPRSHLAPQEAHYRSLYRVRLPPVDRLVKGKHF